MASKVFYVKGIQCEMWETSFRIDGMHQVIRVGHDISKELVESYVSATFEAIEQRAIEAGKEKLAEAAKKLVTQLMKDTK